MDIANVLLTLRILCGLLTFYFCRLLLRPISPDIVLGTYEELSGLLKEKSLRSDWYERRLRFLVKNGAPIHYGEWINPVRYLGVQILLGCLGFFTGIRLGIAFAFLFALSLFFLPELLLIYLNRRDNDELLPEIKLVYQSLEIQIGAGIYVTDALAECYGIVENIRLNKALLELAGDIVMKADLYEALDKFQRNFDNAYIDTLCITILQAMESGQAIELLRDISGQIREMEDSVAERKKGSLDRKITLYQLVVLACVMGVVVYACLRQMYTVAFYF